MRNYVKGGSIFNDPFVFDTGVKPNDSVWSDRLYQWDPQKHDYLCKKHFGDAGQYWSGRSPEDIQAFLRDYLNDAHIEVCSMEHTENRTTGYPLWHIKFKRS